MTELEERVARLEKLLDVLLSDPNMQHAFRVAELKANRTTKESNYKVKANYND